MALPLAELSYDSSEALGTLAENYFDDEREICADPFDILAALEEETGQPIYFN